MLSLLVALVILALIVWAVRAVAAGMGAPPWMLTVVVAIALIFAIVLIAQAFGIATPMVR